MCVCACVCKMSGIGAADKERKLIRQHWRDDRSNRVHTREKHKMRNSWNVFILVYEDAAGGKHRLTGPIEPRTAVIALANSSCFERQFDLLSLTCEHFVRERLPV